MGFQKPKLPKRRVKKRKYIKTSVDKFEKPKLPKRRKKTKKTELPKISIKKTKTPSPLSLRTPAPTPELDLSNDLLEFIKGFEAEYPNERNVKEAFQRAVIDDFEEFEDMISDGTIRSQNFLEMKEEDVAPSKVPYKYMSSVREQELIKKLIKYYKESYDVDDSSFESDFESAVNGVQEEEEDKNDVDSDDELEILIKTLKPEIKKIKKDLIKPTKVKVITPKIIKKIPSSKKKTPTLKKKTQKRKNDFEKLLKKIDKLSNTEVDAELKKLKLDSDIDYLKQVILSRLENML
jgi:hypothetical protein